MYHLLSVHNHFFKSETVRLVLGTLDPSAMEMRCKRRLVRRNYRVKVHEVFLLYCGFTVCVCRDLTFCGTLMEWTSSRLTALLFMDVSMGIGIIT